MDKRNITLIFKESEGGVSVYCPGINRTSWGRDKVRATNMLAMNICLELAFALGDVIGERVLVTTTGIIQKAVNFCAQRFSPGHKDGDAARKELLGKGLPIWECDELLELDMPEEPT